MSEIADKIKRIVVEHLGVDEAGPHDEQVRARAGEARLDALGERVEAGL